MAFDRRLKPGETADFDRDFYNSLVDWKRSENNSGPVRLELSAREAQVSASGEMSPSSVWAVDSTRWGALSPERHKVVFELLRGPGHFTEAGGSSATLVEKSLGESAEWTWDSSDSPALAWDAKPDGSPLPAEVGVRMQVMRLTTETTDPSVETLDDLPTGAEGDRRLVREDWTVYVRQSEDGWAAAEGPTWVVYGENQKSFLVARAHNPDYVPEGRARISPDTPVAQLSGGSATVTIRDETLFPEDAQSATRSLSAKFVDGVSEGIAVTQAHSAAMERPAAKLSVSRAGRARVEAVYDVRTNSDTETMKAYAEVEVMAASAPVSSGRAQAPRNVNVTPGDGEFTVQLGKKVVIAEAQEAAVLQREIAPSSDDFLAEAQPFLTSVSETDIAQRISVESETAELSSDQIDRLQEARRLIENTISSGSEGLSVWDLQLEGASATEGEVIRTEDGDSLLVIEGGQAPRALGRLEASLFPVEACVGQGAGQEVGVEIEARFGGKRPAFFHARKEASSMPSKFTFELPRREPQEMGEQWEVKGRAFSTFGFRPAYVSISQTRGERIPTQDLAVRIEDRYPGTVDLVLEGSAEFWGEVQLLERGSEDTRPLNEDSALSRASLQPKRREVHAPVRHLSGTVAVVRGAQRARSGSMPDTPERRVSAVFESPGMPEIQLSEEEENQQGSAAVDPPTQNGVYLHGPTRTWVSVNGSWIPFGQETTSATLQARSGSGAQLPVSQPTARTFRVQTDTSTGDVNLDLQFPGGIRSASVSTGVGAGSFDRSSQTLSVTVPAARVPGRFVAKTESQSEQEHFWEVEVASSVSDSRPASVRRVTFARPDGTAVPATKVSSGLYEVAHGGYTGSGNARLKLFFDDSTAVRLGSGTSTPGGAQVTGLYAEENETFIVSTHAEEATVVVEADGTNGSTTEIVVEVAA